MDVSYRDDNKSTTLITVHGKLVENGPIICSKLHGNWLSRTNSSREPTVYNPDIHINVYVICNRKI